MPGRPIIIKYGGSLLEDPDHRREFLKDIAKLSKQESVVLVHGGGKEITRALEEEGVKSQFDAQGRRVTDGRTMLVVEQVLRRINQGLVEQLVSLGLRAMGFSGKDERLATAAPLPDLGRVGDPERLTVNRDALERILKKSELPVFYSVGVDAAGESININADDFAQALAIACSAKRLVFLTDTGGIHDPKGKTLSTIVASEIGQLISQKVITKGMVVKAQACLKALHEGVACVDIRKGIKDLLNGVSASEEGTVFIP